MYCVRKAVDDLGLAAFVKMHGFKVVGRKNKSFYFDIKPEEEKEFNQTLFEYANSQCHTFDSEIMALKRMPHYVIPPNEFS